MTRYFVSRHDGAIAWAKDQNLEVDCFVTHLDPTVIAPNDVVMGSLPVSLAAQVSQRGAQYWHLELNLPAQLRGQELSSDQLINLQATLKRYHVEILPINNKGLNFT